jgi:hypothetical protein
MVQTRQLANRFWMGVWCAVLVPLSVYGQQAPAPSPETRLKLPTPDLPGGESREDHPLVPVVRMAIDSYRWMRADVRDYTCVMVRRERIEGRLRPHEYIYAKVRHRQVEDQRIVVPFSIYLKFLKPASVQGREVLYVEGKNGGEMFARRGGTRFAFVTTRLLPDSDLAMRDNLYPITEFGIENLLYRLIQSARRDLQSDCQVQFLPGAKINDRAAEGIIVTHQSRQVSPNFYQARIFVDKELRLPVHYEAYDWPASPDAEPPVMEQYTYTQLQLNQGLTDADFSEDNPQYHVK